MAIESLIIGGTQVPAAEGATFPVIEPGTGSSMAEVAEAGPEDAARAVATAYRAFEEGPWPRRLGPTRHLSPARRTWTSCESDSSRSRGPDRNRFAKRWRRRSSTAWWSKRTTASNPLSRFHQA